MPFLRRRARGRCRLPLLRSVAASAFAAVLVVACGPYLFDPLETARGLAGRAGWRESRLNAPPFTLAAFHTPAATTETLHVYIEGDGRGWRSRRVPPVDPTPGDPLGLKLALADPAPAVLYLARPCQYVRDDERGACDPAYWTTYRFAPEVIAATDAAIDRFLADHPAPGVKRRLVLFGYSGGGDVAALVAGRRSDVAALVTIAAPLDHAAWTRHHAVQSLSGSLNPADSAGWRGLAQVHLLGGRDTIVPPAVARPLIERLQAEGGAARILEMPAYDHECCWAENWRAVLGGLALP